MDIGKNIKNLRIKNNLTQAELAEEIGIARASLCQIERGTRTISLPLSQQIAEIFGCTVDDLIKGNEATKEVVRR